MLLNNLSNVTRVNNTNKKKLILLVFYLIILPWRCSSALGAMVLVLNEFSFDLFDVLDGLQLIYCSLPEKFRLAVLIFLWPDNTQESVPTDQNK